MDKRGCYGMVSGVKFMKPRPYQEKAADFLYENDRAMILAPVGAGKTMITLIAMQDMLRYKYRAVQ